MSKRGGDNINHDAHLWGSLFGLGFTIALIAAMQPVLFELYIGTIKKSQVYLAGDKSKTEYCLCMFQLV